jgi:catechol 2,3-dioxygenase-like lactoylglutathione lyase family enzyme
VFAHVVLRASDARVSIPPLRAALAALGPQPDELTDTTARWGALRLVTAHGRPVTRGLHLAFVAPTLDGITAFWTAGLAAGLADDGAPGPRPHYGAGYHGAYLRDRDGNSLEAVHHAGAPRRGLLDHITARVRDLDAATALCERVAAAAGLHAIAEAGGTAIVGATPGDSLLLLPGSPTRGLDVTYAAGGRASLETIDAEGNRISFVAGSITMRA